MLVNHEFRFIFIKTKKTGSSSTEVWLRHYCTAENAIVSPRTVGRDDPRRNHSSAREVHALVGEVVWQRYRSIVNVRNPWDKLASLLFFRPGRTARFGGGSLEITDLDDARRRLERMTATFQRPSCDRFLEPGSPAIDTALRLDRLDTDLRTLAAELGLPEANRRLPHHKSGTRPDWARDWRPLYTDAAAQSVAALYDDWITTFGYRFDQREATR